MALSKRYICNFGSNQAQSHHFLVRFGRGKSAAHIWIDQDQDTACRMWSTGGIRHTSQYKLSADTFGNRICHMCQAVNARNRSVDDSSDACECSTVGPDHTASPVLKARGAISGGGNASEKLAPRQVYCRSLYP